MTYAWYEIEQEVQKIQNWCDEERNKMTRKKVTEKFDKDGNLVERITEDLADTYTSYAPGGWRFPEYPYVIY